MVHHKYFTSIVPNITNTFTHSHINAFFSIHAFPYSLMHLHISAFTHSQSAFPLTHSHVNTFLKRIHKFNLIIPSVILR